MITDIISKDDAIEIVAGVDMNTENYAGYPVFKSLDECPEADVIIDFSTAKAVDRPVGLLRDEEGSCGFMHHRTFRGPVKPCERGEQGGRKPSLRNMSIGINLLKKTLKEVVRSLRQGFDIEILEKHHNRKIDAPSGTRHRPC